MQKRNPRFERVFEISNQFRFGDLEAKINELKTHLTTRSV